MSSSIIFAATALAITAMLCFAATRAWKGWLEVKRLELAKSDATDEVGAVDQDIGLRIELAAVRERLKKLEEIAAGVEL